MRNAKGQFVKGMVSERRTSVPVKCAKCSKVFMVQPHRFKGGRGKFCSVACRASGMFTSEVRKKLSAKRKGRPNPAVAGKKCHFWKGGITPESKKERMSLKTRMWREAVYKRDNYTCVLCGKRGGRLNADHILPFSQFPAYRHVLENGRTLCVACHKKTDTYGGRMRSKLIDEYKAILAAL